MRIAVFYNLFFSGAKRTVFEHVRGLVERGHLVDVYTIDSENDIFDPSKVANNEYRYEYKPAKLNLPLFRKISKDFSDFFLLPNIQKKIANEIDKKKYNIVLVETDQITQAPFILKYLNTKNVYFCLEPLKIGYEYSLRVPSNLFFLNKLYENVNRNIRKKIDRENARAADHTIAISKFGRELMIQAFDLYPKISYLGVNSSLFKNLNTKKKNQILFVGQKINMNGYDIAVAAVNAIPKKIRPILKTISISKDKTKRHTDREMVNFYNESLLVLSLSNYDTFGLVPLEAMACEVPVIAFDVGGYRETIIDGKTGFLIDFDEKMLKDKIINLLKNPKLMSDMGEEGRKWVEENWTWKKQILELEKYLKDISNPHN